MACQFRVMGVKVNQLSRHNFVAERPAPRRSAAVVRSPKTVSANRFQIEKKVGVE
jgi:hypothetical protein